MGVSGMRKSEKPKIILARVITVYISSKYKSKLNSFTKRKTQILLIILISFNK